MLRRQRGQSVVEFGIIAILFTLMMFAIADFGLLLNDWLSVSTAARQLGRDASVGAYTCQPGQCPGGVPADLWNQASAMPIPGVFDESHFLPNPYCCKWGNPGSPLQLMVIYYDQCSPQAGVGTCNEVDATDATANGLDSRYSSHLVAGHCTAWTTGTPCAHPSPPRAGTCNGHTCPGDTVVITLKAAGAQVITPLVRPFFGSPGVCPDSSSPSHCYVALSSTVTMRFEGDTL